MAKDIMPEMNIGLAGHVDHGKTTLTKSLSGKWTDTHSEEVKRGITIKLGYADIAIRKCFKCKGTKTWTTNEKCSCGARTKIIRKVSLVDAPGHETLMAIMLSGAAIMDAALLLISANELCPQPQTQEHLAALKILGIKKIIVLQNKIDLVTKTQAKDNYNKIKDFVKKNLGFDVPIIPISAQKNVNIDILIEAIQEFMPTPKRDSKKNPEFLIARSFDINKPGTEIPKLIGGIIGGAITQGIFKKNQEIEIKPGINEKKTGKYIPIITKIESIVVGSNFVDDKGPGGSVAFSTTLDPTMTRGDALVGNLAGLPGELPDILYSLNIETHLFNHILGIKENIEVTPIKINEPLMINIGTSTTVGIPTQVGNKIKLNLKRPVCAHKGTKIAISRQVKNRWHLIGFGVIR